MFRRAVTHSGGPVHQLGTGWQPFSPQSPPVSISIYKKGPRPGSNISPTRLDFHSFFPLFAKGRIRTHGLICWFMWPCHRRRVTGKNSTQGALGIELGVKGCCHDSSFPWKRRHTLGMGGLNFTTVPQLRGMSKDWGGRLIFEGFGDCA